MKNLLVVLATMCFITLTSANVFADSVTSPTTSGPEENKSRIIDDGLLKIDVELGYYYGGLELPDSQGFGAGFTFYKNSKSKHKFGVDVGAELNIADVTDIDSRVRRTNYFVYLGMAYKYQFQKELFSVKTGLMYQNTRETISAIGIDFSQFADLGIDPATIVVTFKRDQSGYLLYNRMKYEKEFSDWKMNGESEVRIQLSQLPSKFSTNLPAGSMGSTKPDQSLAFLKFDMLRKFGDNSWFGVQTKPVIWTGVTKMFATEVGLAYVYKHLRIEVGYLFNPFGFPRDAELNKATFENTQRARVRVVMEF